MTTPLDKALRDSTVADLFFEYRDMVRKDPLSAPMVEALLDREIFDRVHPDIDRFLFDRQYLGIPAHEVRPNVRKAFNLITNTHEATIVKMLLGSGSGKSYIVSHLLTYKTHEFLSHINPQAYYGLATGSPVSILNLSTNAGQAMNVIFKTFKGLIESLPTFENVEKKFKIRRSEYEVEPYHDLPTGANPNKVPEKYRAARAEIEFPEKNLLCISGHSKAASFYGYSVFTGTIDEANHIERETRPKKKTRIEQETTYTEELFAGLRKACFTRFGKNGLLFLISTALAKTAFLDRRILLDISRGFEIGIDDGHIFVEHEVRDKNSPECYFADSLESPGNELTIIAPTWVMTNEDRGIYIKDETDIKALRDFGCVMPDAASGALPHPEIVSLQANKERLNPWDEEKHIIDFDLLQIDRNASYFMHWDLSLTGDNVGLCLLHRSSETGQYVIDLFGNVITSQQRPFDMNLPVRICLALTQAGVHIASVTFDGWQSVKLIQDLAALGLPAAQLSVDRNRGPYDTLISMLIQDMMDYPEHEQFEKEMRYLEDMGDKYDHPSKFPDGTRGSKDVADAGAGSLFTCVTALTGTLLTAGDMDKATKGVINVNSTVKIGDDETPICELDDRWMPQWNFKDKTPPMYNRAAYVDTVDGNTALLMIGYKRAETFIVDFIEEYDIGQADTAMTVLANIIGMKSEFVGAAPTAPYPVMESIRSAGVRVMTPEMDIKEMRREKHMRPVRAIRYPQVEVMIQAIKTGTLRFCDHSRLTRELYGITEGNYDSMPLACALAGWYHYVQQNQRKSLAQTAPKPILNHMAPATSRLPKAMTGPAQQKHLPRSVVRKRY